MKKKQDPPGLQEYLQAFLDQHKLPYGSRQRLIVTDDDCMQLGEFFIRGIVGWASGYDLLRVPESMRQSVIGYSEETDREEDHDCGHDEDEADDEETFIH